MFDKVVSEFNIFSSILNTVLYQGAISELFPENFSPSLLLSNRVEILTEFQLRVREIPRRGTKINRKVFFFST